MWHDILFLLMGLVLIVAGGNYVTDGAVAMATRFKVTPAVIGLTVVAFGSSTPDLVVSVLSTVQHKSELAIGDVVGAGIFDMLLVVGITALIMPIKISKSALWCDLPVMVVAALIIFFCAEDRLMDGHATNNILDRGDGLVMLLVFALFMLYTFNNARKQATMPDRATRQVQKQQAATKPPMKMWLAITCIVLGLGALVIGGDWIVDGASGIALKAGMSEAMVGLTIVAIGSSVPDIASSVAAALKGQAGLAMGNVVGACIMDMLFVLGTCAVIHPLNAGHVSLLNFATMAGAAIVVWLLAMIGKGPKEISRPEGAVLVILYIAYIVALIMTH